MPDTQHEAAKAALDRELLDSIQREKDPLVAVARVSDLDPVTAVALLDSMVVLLAAIILFALKVRGDDGDEHALLICERAESLGIEATKGVCHGRDKLFEQTGVFLL